MRPASASSTSRCCFAFKRYLTSLRSKVSVNEAIVSSQGPSGPHSGNISRLDTTKTPLKLTETKVGSEAGRLAPPRRTLGDAQPAPDTAAPDTWLRRTLGCAGRLAAPDAWLRRTLGCAGRLAAPDAWLRRTLGDVGFSVRRFVGQISLRPQASGPTFPKTGKPAGRRAFKCCRLQSSQNVPNRLRLPRITPDCSESLGIAQGVARNAPDCAGSPNATRAFSPRELRRCRRCSSSR